VLGSPFISLGISPRRRFRRRRGRRIRERRACLRYADRTGPVGPGILRSEIDPTIREEHKSFILWVRTAVSELVCDARETRCDIAGPRSATTVGRSAASHLVIE
jgi:hypothetical protein